MAARLVFNLTFAKANRPRVVAQGGLKALETLLEPDGPASGSGASSDTMVLCLAKALLMLATSSACTASIVAWSKFGDVWTYLAHHSDEQVRERAAGVAALLLDRGVVGRSAVMALPGIASLLQSKSPGLGTDKNTRAKSLRSKYAAAVSEYGHIHNDGKPTTVPRGSS